MVVTPRSKEMRILVAGALARRPRAGGHAWVFLQYLLGLRRLGYEVLFVDWLDAETCNGPVEHSSEAAYLSRLMDEHGLTGSWSLLDHATGDAAAGLPRAEVVEHARTSALLLNVMGYLDDEEILAATPLRVFLDIDPGFPQMWHELGLADVFAGPRPLRHDRRAGRPGRVRGAHVRARLDHDPATRRAGALARSARQSTERSRPSPAGEAPSRPSSTRVSGTGCGRTSSGSSPSYPSAADSASSLRLTSTRKTLPTANCSSGAAGSSSTRSRLRPILLPTRTTSRAPKRS